MVALSERKEKNEEGTAGWQPAGNLISHAAGPQSTFHFPPDAFLHHDASQNHLPLYWACFAQRSEQSELIQSWAKLDLNRPIIG